VQNALDDVASNIHQSLVIGVATVVGDGTALEYTYTPDVNFVGTDSFTYRVTDSQAATADAEITITVEVAPGR